MPHTHPDLYPFPELSDDAVLAVNDFIVRFYTRFQKHDFAQMYRSHHDKPDTDRYQLPLPLDDPPA